MTLYEKYVSCGYKVTTDSRAVKGGELFFALRGENFDGNAYALKALELGAAYAVVNLDANLPDDARLVKVEDPFTELQQLAIYHRNHVLGEKHLPVIGLTGTNGKTTTKELIREVLSRKYKVTATEGNLNNDIGVPLSLLKITPDTEIAVIEMGANHPDDITKLVQVSQPDYGIITNVGKAHLLGFGSFEGVKAAKGELYRYLVSKQGSVVFINADDQNLCEMAKTLACHVWQYGLNYQNAQILPATAENPFVRLKIGDENVCSNLVGAYNANNILAALSIGEYFGVKRSDALAAIAEYVPHNNRSMMQKTDYNVLILDAYNANPSSMNAALDHFASVVSDKKVALLGDMRELGSDSLKEHESIVNKISGMDLTAYLVGDEFGKALQSCRPSNVAGHYANSADLAAYLHENPIKGSVVLVKGSRGIMMEKTIPEL